MSFVSNTCNLHAIQSDSFARLHGYKLCFTSSFLAVVYSNHGIPRICCSFTAKRRGSSSGNRETREEGSSDILSRRRILRGKDNVWSVDNKRFQSSVNRETKLELRKRRFKMIRNMKRNNGIWVSGAMSTEVEKVTKPEESAISPIWGSFMSGVCGLWKGVGALFSPATAEMAPVDLGNDREQFFDRFLLSNVELKPPSSKQQKYEVFRKTHWGGFNPANKNVTDASSILKNLDDFLGGENATGESDCSEYMEEDIISYDNEPGLVFFEDGSYSRGPVEIPLAGSESVTLPTFLFEQCLVQGSHRLRTIHTMQFKHGVPESEVLLVALYEEHLVSSFNDEREIVLDITPFSERKRLGPSKLSGCWKVLETIVAPVDPEKMVIETTQAVAWRYTCTETLQNRERPEYSVGYTEKDLDSAPMIWLPGGVSAYAYTKEGGNLCIGFGRYSDEGKNFVMERCYGPDSRLREIRRKTEYRESAEK